MIKRNYNLGSLFAVFLIFTSCKNFSTATDKNISAPTSGTASGSSATAANPDRKQIIKLDKKKQSDLDLPFRGFDYDKKITTLALGSSANQNLPQPIWKIIEQSKPDLFLFAGDTVTLSSDGRTETKLLAPQFKKLNMVAEFRSLREKIPFLTVWNNSDFGMNYSGGDNPDKELRRTEFIKYWSYLQTALPQGQKALYHAKIFGPKKQKVQIIMLDTRWDRSPLKKNPEDHLAMPTSIPSPTPQNSTEKLMPLEKSGSSAAVDATTKPAELVPEIVSYPQPFLSDDDKSKHFLTEEQWTWLENELKKPSELKFLVSSIQVIPNDHHFEKWGNFPAERERLFRLLIKTKAKNLILLSGDRHLGAIAKLEVKKLGPIFEMTSSGLNGNFEKNKVLADMTYLKDAYAKPNFGLVKINWEKRKVILEIHSETDEVKDSAEISF